MRRFIQWLLLCAVLGAAGWFLARWALGSALGRDVAERRLGRFLDMEVTVGVVGLEWPFTVVLNGVEGRFPNGSTRNADLHVQEVRLHPLRRRHAEIRRPSIRLVRSGTWDWQPVVLRSLVLKNGAADPVEEVFDRVAQALGTKWSFEVTSATVFRRDPEGEDLPVFGGLSWRMHPLVLEGHGRVAHHRVAFQSRNGASVGGDGLTVVEWLSARGQPPLRLWSGTAPASCGSQTLPAEAGGETPVEPAPVAPGEGAAEQAQPSDDGELGTPPGEEGKAQADVEREAA